MNRSARDIDEGGAEARKASRKDITPSPPSSSSSTWDDDAEEKDGEEGEPNGRNWGEGRGREGVIGALNVDDGGVEFEVGDVDWSDGRNGGGSGGGDDPGALIEGRDGRNRGGKEGPKTLSRRGAEVDDNRPTLSLSPPKMKALDGAMILWRFAKDG